MSCRQYTPLTGPELGMLEAWLDQTADPLTNTAVVRRLLATTRKLEGELRQARRHEETAWAILAVDCDPTDFPKEP